MDLGGTIGEWSDKTKKFAQQTSKEIEGLIQSTGKDISDVFDDLKECAAAADSIRNKLTNRYIEHHSAILRIGLDSHLMTRDLIEIVWKYVRNNIGPKKTPRIYKLTDPYNSSSAIEIKLENFEFPQGRYPCLFVHGMFYEVSINSAYSFFWDVEGEIELFKTNDYKNYDVYLLSYDTDLTDDIDDKIKLAFQFLFGINPKGESLPLVLAVFWRELEERAEKAGDYLLDFLKKLVNFYNDSNIYPKGFAITHSLGCFTLASAAQKLIEENNMNSAFSKWLCCAAAIPCNGFTKTGFFNLAPRIAGPADGPQYGTSVWYSHTDLVLNHAYPLANPYLPMGVTGPLEAYSSVTALDVTAKTHEDHHQAYFKKIKSELKSTFGI
ncbi:TPA: hypothetical protein ACIQN7_002748 [Bacillus cereus]